MKNKMSIIGFIVISVIIAFTFSACGGADDPCTVHTFLGGTIIGFTDDGLTLEYKDAVCTCGQIGTRPHTPDLTINSGVGGTFNETGTVLITGNISNSILITTATQIFIANDTTISTSNGDALTIPSNATIIGGGNGITITSTDKNGIYVDGDLIISGILGNIKASWEGIYADNNGTLIVSGIIGNIDGNGHGIWGEYVTINGTIGDISGNWAALRAGVHLAISGKIGNINANKYGIYAYNNIGIAATSDIGDVVGGEFGMYSENGIITIHPSAKIKSIGGDEGAIKDKDNELEFWNGHNDWPPTP